MHTNGTAVQKVKDYLAVPEHFRRTALAFPGHVDKALALIGDDMNAAKHLLDQAATLEHLARRVRADTEVTNAITYGKLKIVATIGRLSPAAKPKDRGRGRKKTLSVGDRVFRANTLSDYRKVARHEARLDDYRAQCGNETEASTAGFVRFCTGADKARRKAEQRQPPPLPPGSYRLILADPPWEYEFAETECREIENHYPTMTVAQLQALVLPAAPDCVLFLWATAPKLPEALAVLEAWGFAYRTGAVWDKGKIGMGYWFRGQHEHLQIGVRGNASPPREAHRPSSVIREPRGRHSAKPEAAYRLVEAMYPDYGERDRLELFSRKQRPGWTVWGHECASGAPNGPQGDELTRPAAPRAPEGRIGALGGYGVD
jgi:N6-adenosine-specific RNA methylase IME4